MSESTISDPLDLVAYLTRSRNRVIVLETLNRIVCTRGELKEMTGISQATLGRILDVFVQRGWVEKGGQTYCITPLGTFLAEELLTFLHTVNHIMHLEEVARLLPPEEIDFDLSHLSEATIVRPSQTDAIAPVRRMLEHLGDADRVTLLTNTVASQGLAATNRAISEGNQSLEAVITDEAYQMVLNDSEMYDLLQEMIASERAHIYHYEGSVPHLVALCDGTGIISPANALGIPQAVIETTNETVCDWIADTVEEYRQQARLLTVEVLPEL